MNYNNKHIMIMDFSSSFSLDDKFFNFVITDDQIY